MEKFEIVFWIRATYSTRTFPSQIVSNVFFVIFLSTGWL